MRGSSKTWPNIHKSNFSRTLGLQSLSGIVYSITEIPVDLIREIVDARIAELAGGAPLQTPVPADVDALVMERLQPILHRLAALEQAPAEEPAPIPRFDPLAALPEPAAEPDWNLVKRHFRRYGNPEASTAQIRHRDPRTQSPCERMTSRKRTQGTHR
ncbi:MAG: hypothetical protein NTW21_04840 [Verrucomicrobia bacterium]|nr:hypothetical protein [Verrucomicrobiota bacterium]